MRLRDVAVAVAAGALLSSGSTGTADAGTADWHPTSTAYDTIWECVAAGRQWTQEHDPDGVFQCEPEVDEDGATRFRLLLWE